MGEKTNNIYKKNVDNPGIEEGVSRVESVHWVASWTEPVIKNGKMVGKNRKKKRFSVKQHGEEKAKELAVEYRKEMEAKFYTKTEKEKNNEEML